MSGDTVRDRAVDWLTFAFACGAAALSGALELMLVPLYLGSVNIPVSVVLAVLLNVVLPQWGARALGRGIGAVIPVLLWLIVLLGLSMVTRPEGDIFVEAAHGQQYVYYALVLLGAITGFTMILRATAPAPKPRNATRPR